MNKRVYSGATAVGDYLRPTVTDYSPLVELPPTLNPYFGSHDIHIYVKLLNTLPLANVKSLPAWNLLQQAPGDINQATIVESSSGNTVFSMGILAQHFGVKKVMAIASKDVTPGKLNLLRLAGIDVQLVDGPICPSPDDPHSSISIAKRLGEQRGWYNPGQYDNDHNPDAHRQYTGPQLYEQLGGTIGMFVAGLGTTGTLVGTADYLRSVIDDIQVIGVVRAPNNAVPGVRTKKGLQEVAFNWAGLVTNGLVTVNERDSYEKSLALIRQGLLVGPSTGFAFAGVLKQLEAMHGAGMLDTIRGKNIVFVAPDSMFPYIDEYMAVLDPHQLGVIDDRTTRQQQEATEEIGSVPELSADDIYQDYIPRGDTVMSQHYTIIDVRTVHEYEDHHLPGSLHVSYDDLDAYLAQLKPQRPLVFVCRRGTTSLRAAWQARQRGFEAYSMTGGTTEWSARDYPRILPLHC